MSDEGKEIALTEKESVGHTLVDKGLAIMRQRYGTGAGDGETPRIYHNTLHVSDVLRAAELISDLAIKKGRMLPGEEGLAKIAVAYHDTEQQRGSGIDEEVSAQEAAAAMAAEKVFSREEIEKVILMILATRIFFDKKGVMRQRITGNYLSKMMADADLSTLGASPELCWDRAIRLLKEFKRTESLSEDDIQVFAAEQAIFIQDHPFHTEEARLLFPNARENIRFCLKKANGGLAV